jgi:hypothetical protein
MKQVVEKKGSNINQSTKQSFTAQILYEDGSTEQLDLPDPDVILLIQGIAFLFAFLYSVLSICANFRMHFPKIQMTHYRSI